MNPLADVYSFVQSDIFWKVCIFNAYLVFCSTKDFTKNKRALQLHISQEYFDFWCFCDYVSISCVCYESSGWSSQTKLDYFAVESSVYNFKYERVNLDSLV